VKIVVSIPIPTVQETILRRHASHPFYRPTSKVASNHPNPPKRKMIHKTKCYHHPNSHNDPNLVLTGITVAFGTRIVRGVRTGTGTEIETGAEIVRGRPLLEIIVREWMKLLRILEG
jgi:hypothetical protein